MDEPATMHGALPAPDQDDFNRNSEAFMSWFLSQAGASINPAIALADYRGRHAGRGVQALADIPADTDLFTIPRRSTLSIETSALAQKLPSIFTAPGRKRASSDDSSSASTREDGGQAAPQVERRSWTALILALLYEYLQPAAASPWKAYLDVLPRTFDTLMFWSEDELAHLQGCAVLGKIGKESAEREFRSTLLPIVRAHEGVFFGDGERARAWADEKLVALAHVMGSTIMAYAFDVEDEEAEEQGGDEDGFVTDDEEMALVKAMVPLADLLNADAPPNASLFHGSDSFTMKALRDIAAGEEILNDYGQLPRSDLLRRYGYVTDKYALFDCVEVGLDSVVDAVQGYRAAKLDKEELEQRLEYLEEKDVLEDRSFEIVWPDLSLNGSFFPSTMVRAVCTLFADRSEYKRVAKAMNEEALLRSDIRGALSKLVEARLSDYLTDAEQNGAATPWQENRRYRMADQVRKGELSLLRKALESLAGSNEQPRAKRQRTN